MYINRGYAYIGPLSSYGTQQSAYGSLYQRPWGVSMTKTKLSIDTNNIRQGLAPELFDMVGGIEGGTATITGNLSVEDSVLLKAMFGSDYLDGTAGKEFKIRPTFGWNGTTNDLDYSFTIYKANPDKGATAYDIAKGCVLLSYTLTGNSNGIITFTANFRAKLVIRGTSSTFTGTSSDAPLVNEVINFGDLTFSGSFGQTKLSSYTFTLTNTFIDDANLYQNAYTKDFDIPLSTTATLQIVKNKLLSDYNIDNNLMDDSIYDVEIVLSDGNTGSWTYAYKGKYQTSLDGGDNNNIMSTTQTLMLTDISLGTPILVTVSV